ncbi:MAG TPA: DUF58 domain-containing protein, partial [Saprospiraceae bacterium]|nr:DUF58 domain-containing protein [Saprospiraceae bacterium]
EHRIYNQGESTKNLDWKVFARTDKLFTKKFEEETNLRCHIVIDDSSSMYFPQSDNPIVKNKIQFSVLAAAALMNLLKRQRDAFGLTIFDDHIKINTQCKSSSQHYRLLISYLEQAMDDKKELKSTSAAQALHQIAETIHKRSLVIIFSDMFESQSSNEELFGALQHLKHAKHEVVLFHVTDKEKEIEFDYENRPYQFIDMETGEKIKLQSNEVKEHYKKNINEYLSALKMKCLQYKIDMVEANINEGFKPILQAYLVKRSKMNI